MTPSTWPDAAMGGDLNRGLTIRIVWDTTAWDSAGRLWNAQTPRRDPSGRPGTPRSRRSTTSPGPGSPRRRPPRWPATPGRPYASQWNRFRSWCERRGFADPLAAEPAQVAAYLAERAETRKLATVQASAAAIRGRLPRHRAGGPDEDAAGLGHAARPRAPARGRARGGAAPGRRARLRDCARSDAVHGSLSSITVRSRGFDKYQRCPSRRRSPSSDTLHRLACALAILL